MKNKYDVIINNCIDGYADIVNYCNRLLLNIKKIKKENCSIFVIDYTYNNTKVKVLTMAQLHINENDCLELVYEHILKFRIVKNDFL